MIKKIVFLTILALNLIAEDKIDNSLEAQAFITDVNSFNFAKENPKVANVLSTVINSEMGQKAYKKAFSNDPKNQEIIKKMLESKSENEKSMTLNYSIILVGGFVFGGLVFMFLSTFLIRKVARSFS